MLGIYTEAPRTGYPAPARPEPPLSAPPVDGAALVDPDSPLGTVVLAEGEPALFSEVHVGTAVIGHDSALHPWAGGPGTLTVVVDGVVVTDDGDDPQDWADQQPDLRDGGWQVFTPGRARTLDLPAEVLPAEGQTRRVQVGVRPAMGTYGWQVAVTGIHADATDPIQPGLDSDGEGTDASGLPEWFGGLHREATWQVPADARLHELDLPDGLEGTELTWATVCPDAPGGGELLPGAPATVVIDGVTAGEPVCGSVEDALARLSTVTASATRWLPEVTGPVQVALPAGSGGTGTVAAYREVDLEEFDFDAAPPAPWAERIISFPEGEAEVGLTLTSADLDAEGRAQVTLPRGARTIELGSEGAGRVRLTLDGRPVELLADGWWSFWCDMPPAQDANITAPAATLRVDGEEAVVTCAGKQGGPPVSVFTPLPSSATATVELTGDLPPTGSAVLGIYEEALGDGVPIRRERLPDAVPPPVPTDAVAITPDHPGLNHPMSGLERYVRAVEIGHDTQLQVWAGQTGGVAVHVDGFPVTDDGDVPFMRELFTAEVVVDGSVSDPSPAPQLDWRDQDPHLRQGTWVVQVPGDLRTFPVPEDARPAPGERRIVSVEVMSQSLDGLVQAVASDAAPGPAAQEVTALASGDPELGTVPEFAHGFALRAAWPIPQDGLTRAVPGGDLPDDVRLLVLTEDSHLGDWWSPQSSTGAIERGGRMDLLTIEPAPESLTAQMWFAQPFPLPDDVQDSAAPSRLGELRIALPPVPGHPSAHLLAYEQVAFEDFDFTDAPAPQSSWLLGDDAQTPDRVIDTLTRDDLDEHGRARVEVPGGASLGFEVTAAGRGELRVLVDGEPLPGTESRDGWWSTWTEQEVSVALHTEQTFSGSVGGADDVVVEIEVRGYAELLTVELVDTRYG